MVNYRILGQTALLDEFFNGILTDCVRSRTEQFPPWRRTRWWSKYNA